VIQKGSDARGGGGLTGISDNEVTIELMQHNSNLLPCTSFATVSSLSVASFLSRRTQSTDPHKREKAMRALVLPRGTVQGQQPQRLMAKWFLAIQK
jgi:hypothetical protein